jgi:hypothetical protein
MPNAFMEVTIHTIHKYKAVMEVGGNACLGTGGRCSAAVQRGRVDGAADRDCKIAGGGCLSGCAASD